MHLLPDGRVLVYAPHQLVFGDGVRWQMFRQKPNTSAGAGTCVAVDKDGSIYVATRKTFDVAKLTESALWEPVPASEPDSLSTDYPVPRVVLEVGDQWIWHSGSGVLLSWRPGQKSRIIGHAEDVQHIFQFRGSVYFSDRNSGAFTGLWTAPPKRSFPSRVPRRRIRFRARSPLAKMRSCWEPPEGASSYLTGAQCGPSWAGLRMSEVPGLTIFAMRAAASMPQPWRTVASSFSTTRAGSSR